MLLQWDLNFDEKVGFGARLQLDGGFVLNEVYFSALEKNFVYNDASVKGEFLMVI